MTHQELIDSAASYALDALDGTDRVEFEAHLATCADCRAEVAAYREVAAALAYAAPTSNVAPPPELRDRILRDARQVRPITSAGAAPSVARRSNGAWIVAAASLAAAVGFAFVYRTELAENARLRTELAVAQGTIAREDSTLAAFIGPEVHVVSLVTAAGGQPPVRVFWNHTEHRFIVTANGLPPAPRGKTYQLWAIRKGQNPMSMGTFDADADGRTVIPIAVPQQITDGGFIDDCALTIEPTGGSPQPTETPRMVGSWRHVD